MIIALLAGRRFPQDIAFSWLEAHGRRFMGQHNLWRLGATPGTEEAILERLINAGEHVQVYLPYTVDFHQQSSRELISILKRAGKVEECRIKDYAYGSGFVKRNMMMLSGAGLFIAFYDDREGALKKTIEKARNHNKQIMVIGPDQNQSFKYLKIRDVCK